MEATVKFLPVEDDIIRQGDRWCYAKDGNVIYEFDDLQTAVEGAKTKVKPFAVTTDIEVGDEAIRDKTYIKAEVVEINKDAEIISISQGEGVYGDELKCWFKVLGEISPDAVKFVKDGEKIDVEPELVTKPNTEWKEAGSLERVLVQRGKLEYPHKTIYKVKCDKCKTYH